MSDQLKTIEGQWIEYTVPRSCITDLFGDTLTTGQTGLMAKTWCAEYPEKWKTASDKRKGPFEAFVGGEPCLISVEIKKAVKAQKKSPKKTAKKKK